VGLEIDLDWPWQVISFKLGLSHFPKYFETNLGRSQHELRSPTHFESTCIYSQWRIDSQISAFNRRSNHRQQTAFPY
jgi:hypothetical protein